MAKRRKRKYLVVVPITHSGSSYTVRQSTTWATTPGEAYKNVKRSLLGETEPVIVKGQELYYAWPCYDQGQDYSEAILWEGFKVGGTDG